MKSKVLLGALFLGCVGLLVHFYVEAQAGRASLRLAGSNTIGADLAPALVEAFLRSKGSQDVGRAQADTRLVTGTVGNDQLTVSIEALGTATAFTSLAQRQCDVAMASRKITDEERTKLGIVREAVIGLDGIAVIVHPSSLVTSLSTNDLASIFRGDEKRWNRFANGFADITVLARDEKSGTWDSFRSLVLGAGGTLASAAKRFDSNEALVAAVAADPSAIGFTSLSAAHGVKVLPISEPGAAPVVANDFTVATETYPLTRRLYLYTSNKPPDLAAALVAFAQSTDGQALVGKLGFVDLRPRTAPPTDHACQGCTTEYRQTTKAGERLSVDFRFDSGASTLDSRGARDLERVALYVKANHAPRVVLLGFADNRGSQEVNEAVSLDRARAVKQLLVPFGVDAEAVGMGAAMPVASNDTPEGRERNRRVEVWAYPR